MLSESGGSNQALLHFLYRAPIGLVQAELDGTIEMINPMAAQLLMPLCRNGILENLFKILEGAAPQLRELAATIDHSDGTICDRMHILYNPQSRCISAPVILSLSLTKLNDSRLMAMVSDITLEVQDEERKLARELRDAERIDQLTRLPNRVAIQEKIQSAMDQPPFANGNHFAVLFMNCDRFKQINDTLGHAVGDRVLVLAAERLRRAIRADCEDTVARSGSDEFVVFMNNPATSEDVQSVAKRILKSLERPYSVGSDMLHCSISMGVVLQSSAAGDAVSILNDASIAMMQAKRAGGNCFAFFEPEMRREAARLGNLETELRRAIADSQFRVFYQPVIALQDKIPLDGCHSVEALVRWQHPCRGLLPPSEFIGAAEECGLIGQIGEFVLQTACLQFVQWHQELKSNAPQTIAVNLSREQLNDPLLASVIKDILSSSRMLPAHLQLEVTESLASQDVVIQSRLREIKALGVTLALDDFGTGFSSLSCLHLLPIDTIKIDRSFVTEADVSSHHRVLIEATVMVAKSLGMNTVVEGIETHSQDALVRALGCDYGQGFLFSKPLSPTDLPKWLMEPRSPWVLDQTALSPGSDPMLNIARAGVDVPIQLFPSPSAVSAEGTALLQELGMDSGDRDVTVPSGVRPVEVQAVH